jgi:hypothetical protein
MDRTAIGFPARSEERSWHGCRVAVGADDGGGFSSRSAQTFRPMLADFVQEKNARAWLSRLSMLMSKCHGLAAIAVD